jgi:hypothetical protein
MRFTVRQPRSDENSCTNNLISQEKTKPNLKKIIYGLLHEYLIPEDS